MGYHPGNITGATTDDVLGRSNVVVGTLNGTGYADGIPAIQRNVYGSGEGGSLFGSSHLTVNNGYVGYRYNSSGSDDASTSIDERYKEEVRKGKARRHAGDYIGASPAVIKSSHYGLGQHPCHLAYEHHAALA